ncbi:amidase family protein [Achromobacter denitrificans]
MTEFAFGLSGQNATQGTARNPWDAQTARAPGGSSSGAGVAVAAGLAPLALGGDTGGSVRAPAALNGVVGYKPSTGVISRAGCLPLSETLDVLGPISRSVADARLLTQLLAGPDLGDDTTLAFPASAIAALNEPAARGAGPVAVLPPEAWPAPLADAGLRTWQQALEQLARAGFTPTPGTRRRPCRSSAWRKTIRWCWPTRPTATTARSPKTPPSRCGRWCGPASPRAAGSRLPIMKPPCCAAPPTWPPSRRPWPAWTHC